MNFNCLTKILLKLTEVGFSNLEHLNDEMFLEFSSLNPQLEIVTFKGLQNLTSWIFQYIPARTPNLIRLTFLIGIMFSNNLQENSRQMLYICPVCGY